MSNTRRNKALAKRNNRFALTEARQVCAVKRLDARLYTIGSGHKLVRNNYRVSTLTHGLVGGLLLLSAVSAVASPLKYVKENSLKTEGKPDSGLQALQHRSGQMQAQVELKAYPGAHVDPSMYVTTGMNAFQAPTAKKSADGLVAEKKSLDLPIGKILKKVKVIVSSDVRVRYPNKELLKGEKKKFKKMLATIAEKNSMLKCKVHAVLNSPEFKVEFASVTQYIQNKNVLRLKAPLQEDKKTCNDIIHEFHHAFVSEQNRLQNRLQYPGTMFHRSFPLNDKDGHVLQAIVDIGVQRVREYIRLSALPSNQLTSKQKYSLRNLKMAAKNYVPLTLQVIEPTGDVVFNADDIKKYMANGLINENLFFATPFKLNTLNGIDIYYDRFERIHTGEYIVYQKFSADLNDLLASALNDVLFIATYFMPTTYANKKEYIPVETDAHIHQQLSAHYALFTELFPELLNFHKSNSHSSYRQCLTG